MVPRSSAIQRLTVFDILIRRPWLVCTWLAAVFFVDFPESELMGKCLWTWLCSVDIELIQRCIIFVHPNLDFDGSSR